jgi:hypothetical protein
MLVARLAMTSCRFDLVSRPKARVLHAGLGGPMSATQTPSRSVAVNVPRFRIASVMVAVAIAALDFGAIRALLPRHANVVDDQRGMCLFLGALPMANFLAVGMLVGQRRPGSRPFLLGFEAFGAVALAFFIALASCFPREVLLLYLTPVVVPIERSIGDDRPFVMFPIVGLVAVALLGWPQVAFALIGGFLSRRFKITITRRS